MIQPCCIGDVILATATLKALRRAYEHAHLTWAIGRWSKPAIAHHPLIDAWIDTGDRALPLYTMGDFTRFVWQLRAGQFDLAVSLVRSPLMSLAVGLSGIPIRAGLDSHGRGFGYNVRVPIDPNTPRHEAEIYLDVVRALGIDTADCYANVPISDRDREQVQQKLAKHGISGRFVVINPAGGQNPGMQMDVKRFPPELFATLADRLGLSTVIIGGPKDHTIVDAMIKAMRTPAISFVGSLSFGEIAALATFAQGYIGNDTGLTHLAAATGAKTIMILGPTDPIRYAPYAPNAIAIWKPATVSRGGVRTGSPQSWDWGRDGISVDDAFEQIARFLGLNR